MAELKAQVQMKERHVGLSNSSSRNTLTCSILNLEILKFKNCRIGVPGVGIKKPQISIYLLDY